jgi:hypothetical protein
MLNNKNKQVSMQMNISEKNGMEILTEGGSCIKAVVVRGS